MITQHLSSSHQLAREITFAKYKGAPKLKLNSEDYRTIALSMHLSGKTNVAEVLLRNHKETPYQTVEELIGDIQLVLMDSWNQFRLVNRSATLGKLSIEELVNELPASYGDRTMPGM